VGRRCGVRAPLGAVCVVNKTLNFLSILLYGWCVVLACERLEAVQRQTTTTILWFLQHDTRASASR
jgi:hypothetical protein